MSVMLHENFYFEYLAKIRVGSMLLQILCFYKVYVFRAVARFLCVEGGGRGAMPDPKEFFEPQSGKENCFGLLGRSGACFLGKCFK